MSDDLWTLVQKDFEQRRQFGLEKYKRPFTVETYDNFLVQAYEECLDMVVYLRGEIEKRRL